MLSRITTWVALAALGTGLLLSQETRGTITGQVTDATGATIPNADINVVNQSMGTTVNLKSNQSGLYTAPLLIPGQYRVTVSATGFKKYVRENVQLQVADRLEVNAILEIGESEQSVTVSSSAEQLSTESGSLGTTVNSQQIQDLPLAYGNPFALIGAASGATFTGNPKLNRPFEPTHIVGFAIDGTRGNRSDVTIDGAPATATANGNEVIASYVPITDMLSEFRVQTATFDAAQGNTEGGVTNLSIRSGTNSFHGTAYYSLTRKSLWANDFFNNALSRDRGDYRFNRPGFTIGGPVWIPKLYNGKNKTFFQFGYENIHDARPRYDSTTPQVPTLAMKNGDFSQLLALGTNYQIYNPYTRRLVNGQFQEDPFPGNIIPSNLFNPVGKAILDRYFPTPTSPGDKDGQNNLLIPTLPERTKYYNATIRLDQNLGDRQRLYGRYSTYRRDSYYNDYFGTAATGNFFQFFSHNGVLDDTIILSPTLVLDLRYGYNRFIRASDGNPIANGFDLTALGFPAAYNNLIPADIRRFPRIDLTGYLGTGFTGEYRPVDTHSFTATATKTQGAHALRGGLDFRSYRENDSFTSNDQTGRFIFDATYTRGPLSNSATAPSQLGQSVAALLLGLPTNSSYAARATSYAEQSMTWGMFFQDDWKATRKLTLNLGLRYEFETPLTERYNRSVVTFDPSFVPSFAGAAQAAYAAAGAQAVAASQFAVRGGLTFAGVNGNPSGLYNTPKTGFLPRFGFAYQLDPKTVIRGGYGLYQGFLGERRGDVIQTGFSQNTPFSAFASDGVTIVNTLSNPSPNGLLNPVGSSLGGLTGLGQTISFFNQNPNASHANRWQLDIQRQLPGAMLFEVSYVGNKTTGIEITRNINAVPNQYLSTLNVRDAAQNTYLTANLTNPFAGLLPAASGAPAAFTGTTIGRQQLLRPFPQFGDINTTTNEGYSWYHSLQVRADKRFSRGLNVTVNYTFSKWMQATELLNAGDPAPTRMISDQDAPHRFSSTFLYQLPFGKGKQLFTNTHAVVDRIIGGWEIGGFYTFQSGFPLNFSANDYFLTGNNLTLPIDDRTLGRWFNTGAFVTASADQPVSHLRVNPYRFATLRGPRTNNIDLSLIKDTAIRESMKLRFSAQALNAFNHPLFPAPNLVPSNALFGRISASTQANYPRSVQLELKLMF